jgi:Fic family protein
MQYIYSHKNWPNFHWDELRVYEQLLSVKALQSALLGKVSLLGFQLKGEANLEILIADVVQSSEIEGEIYNPEMVRSSIAIRLNLTEQGTVHNDKKIDGIVDMMLDATQNNSKKLSAKRLFAWHGALFPTGRSGLYKIDVAQYRKNIMQVVSGPMGREKVHFQAIDPDKLKNEMQIFINWFNTIDTIDPILKAGIAHFWFITIHPFDDGNGRMARAITDMQMSKADGVNQRFYSLSAEINRDKKNYYQVLEQSQKGDLDITNWLLWFLNCTKQAIISSETVIGKVIAKHQFLMENSAHIQNERQQKMIHKMLDGFEGKLNTSKWAKITKSSTDTALRDINDLVAKGILLKEEAGGRSTHYKLNIKI